MSTHEPGFVRQLSRTRSLGEAPFLWRMQQHNKAMLFLSTIFALCAPAAKKARLLDGDGT